MLDEEMLDRPRKSRIYYDKKFISYPLKPIEAFLQLGFLKSTACVLSYFKAKLFPYKNVKNFQEWVTNQFGHKLFSIFFKTYTEKVWGMKCTDISADWAAQRIKGLSLWNAVISAFKSNKNNSDDGAVIKTLINTFKYPKYGPGMMWETVAKKIQNQGGELIMGAKVMNLYKNDSGLWEVTYKHNEKLYTVTTKEVISSMPVRTLMTNIYPEPNPVVLEQVKQLKYRDFFIVALIIDDHNQFDDNWIYIHDPSVKVGRIQNFKSWSPYMIPQDGKTNCLGMEYFCFEHDGLWGMSDDELVSLAKEELLTLNLVSSITHIKNGYVVRQKKAYPVYDDIYQETMEAVKKEISEQYSGLHLIGRNGMHKYNNQDHAMMTGLLVAENILNHDNQFDAWNVNQDAEYHEEEKAIEERLIPKKVA